jgi:hypothetical protein
MRLQQDLQRVASVEYGDVCCIVGLATHKMQCNVT